MSKILKVNYEFTAEVNEVNDGIEITLDRLKAILETALLLTGDEIEWSTIVSMTTEEIR